jgi:hypothetical protein
MKQWRLTEGKRAWSTRYDRHVRVIAIHGKTATVQFKRDGLNDKQEIVTNRRHPIGQLEKWRRFAYYEDRTPVYVKG